jgi:dienelactone hydrolase
VAEVLLFHHAQGLTAGVVAFADELRHAGHTVHLPDLYDGQTFDELDAGVQFAQAIGFNTIIEKGLLAAADLPHHVVYAGFSLGVLPAQKLAQTRRGAAGALLFHACVPAGESGDSWPDDLRVQVHGMESDEWFAGADLYAARQLTAASEKAELFLYPGNAHLFADKSLPVYDASAAALLTARVIGFLNAINLEREH